MRMYIANTSEKGNGKGNELRRDGSVAQKRNVFEQLMSPKSVGQKQKGSKDHAVRQVLPPPKPTRTFAHDHYFNLKSIPEHSTTTNESTSPTTLETSDIKASSKPKPPVAVRRRSERQLKKVNPLAGKCLSHEYEHILVDRSPLIIRQQNLRRSMSEDSLIRAQAVSFDVIAADDNKPSLYYASTPVPRPKDSAIYDAPVTKTVDSMNSSKQSVSSKLRRQPRDSLPLNHDRSDRQLINDMDIDSDSDVPSAAIDKRVRRAKLMRRRTLMHYDQQEVAFMKRQSPQLFELAALIRLEPNDGSNPMLPRDQKYVPTIVYRYPSSKNNGELCSASIMASLPCLCYPDVSKAVFTSPETYKDEQFVMTITDQFGDRKFAYCYRFVPAATIVEKSNERLSPTGKLVQIIGSNSASSTFFCNETVLHSLPQVVCVVTPVQAPNFYADFVKEAALKAKRIRIGRDVDEFGELSEFLEATFWKPLPPPGGRLIASGPWPKDVVISHRMASSKGLFSGVAALIERIGIDRAMLLFTALLSERRVLLVGDSVPSVAKAVQVAATFLVPFEWPHTFVPVVPDPYVHLCFSPTPYLMGLLRSNLHFLKDLLGGGKKDDEDEEYILILDLDYGIIKDKDLIETVAAGSSSSALHRCLPSRIARTLRENLRNAVASSTEPLFIGATLAESKDVRVGDAFLTTFVDLIGHYREFLVTQQDGQVTFQKQQFMNDGATTGHKFFLKWFVETGMFQIWLKKKLDSALNGDIGGDGRRRNLTLGNFALIDAFDRKLDQMKSRHNQNGVPYKVFVNAVAKRWFSFVKRIK